MKNLSNLSPARGSNTRNKRIGRGIGSGLGKTAGKGHKGKRARSGSGPGPGFEGGQMPMYRRLPKRGFTNLFRTEHSVVNLDALNRFADGTKVTPELLDEVGLIQDTSRPVKILGRGNLTKKLTIAVNKVSGTAKAAVEKLGGKIEEI